MSVTIHWRPKSETSKYFKGGTSTSLQVLKDVFGSTIQESDVRALRAMAKATNTEFYNEVADKVDQVGALEFWGEW